VSRQLILLNFGEFS